MKRENLALSSLPHHLSSAIKNVYKPALLDITEEPLFEAESSEYGACRFGLADYSVAFRVAKTTPTKVGQFVTTWKRPKSGDHILPLDDNDEVDFLIVSVFDETHRRQFIFSKRLMIKKGIMSIRGRGGKLAFRVYPPWTNPRAKAAIKTQSWQLKHFLPIKQDGTADSRQVHQLFTTHKQDIRHPTENQTLK